MRVKVLDTARFPFAMIYVEGAIADSPVLKVHVTLHGVTNTFEVPVCFEKLLNDYTFSGQMTFRQSDFGIAPFSILGGALQVQDGLHLSFRIVATDS